MSHLCFFRTQSTVKHSWSCKSYYSCMHIHIYVCIYTPMLSHKTPCLIHDIPCFRWRGRRLHMLECSTLQRRQIGLWFILAAKCSQIFELLRETCTELFILRSANFLLSEDRICSGGFCSSLRSRSISKKHRIRHPDWLQDIAPPYTIGKVTILMEGSLALFRPIIFHHFIGFV